MNLSAKYLQSDCDFHEHRLISETIDENQSDLGLKTSLTILPNKRLSQITAYGIGMLTSVAISNYHIEPHIENTSYVYKIENEKLSGFDIYKELPPSDIEFTEDEQIAIAITNMDPILPMPPNNTRKVKFKINNKRKGLPSLI